MMIALSKNQKVVKYLRRHGVTVYTRKAWGSKYGTVYAWRQIFKRAYQPADTVVQHITVTHQTGDFKADVQLVERIGHQRFGSGISYNWVVNMTTGEVAVGQPLNAKGTHTVNNKGRPGFSFDQNYWARAIAVLGMPGDQLSEEAQRSIELLLTGMAKRRAITKTFDYLPHSAFTAKDCPCDPTRDKMPAIYEHVRQELA